MKLSRRIGYYEGFKANKTVYGLFKVNFIVFAEVFYFSLSSCSGRFFRAVIVSNALITRITKTLFNGWVCVTMGILLLRLDNVSEWFERPRIKKKRFDLLGAFLVDSFFRAHSTILAFLIHPSINHRAHCRTERKNDRRRRTDDLFNYLRSLIFSSQRFFFLWPSRANFKEKEITFNRPTNRNEPGKLKIPVFLILFPCHLVFLHSQINALNLFGRLINT